MNRALFVIALTLFSVCVGYSQEIPEVRIKDLTLELNDDKNLNVDMDIDLSQLNVKTTQVVVLTPCIVKGGDTLKLNSIGVYGRNRRVFYQRNESEKPTGAKDIELKPSNTQDVVNYNTTVKFVDWMDGCQLKLLRTDFGCCGQSALVSQAELVERFPLERFIPELIYIRPQHEVVKTRKISGSAYVDFPVSEITIYPTYRNNVVELAKIIRTIDSVKVDKDITIKSIFIKGYASPESSYSNNTYLAKGRTESLKQYV